MASTVLSGTGNVTYTNSTGQNVRLVINYASAYPGGYGLTVTWAGASATAAYARAIGRNLAISGGLNIGAIGSLSLYAQNMISLDSYEQSNSALPTEIMLAPGQTFGISSPYPMESYNIVVIPEAG